jgi:hypothetical protein
MFEVLQELVNVRELDKVLSLQATRMAHRPNYDNFAILHGIRQRCHSIKEGRGFITVVRREARQIGSLSPSFYTGIGDLPDETLPAAIRSELGHGIDRAIVGTSIFNFDKAIRNVCRHGLGWVDVDLVNAAFQIFQLKLPQAVQGPIVEYIEHRVSYITRLIPYFNEKAANDAHVRNLSKPPVFARDDVKGLFIRLLFGGSLAGFLGLQSVVD